MKKRILQMKTMAKAMMIVLLLGVAGKMYAYDFSAVCETGQMLYYKITNATHHYVALTCPGDNGWSGYNEPAGDIILPGSVQFDGISYTVTSIGNYAFYSCDGLTGNLIIPNSVTTIGESAFNWCSGMTGTLTIPNSVVSIGYLAFQNCGFTGNLVIPNSVTTISGYAFSGCEGFTGDLIIPNSITKISYGAFMSCKGFTGSLVIPNSVTSIGRQAFLFCSGFTSLIIGNSVSSITDYAFQGCTSLEQITIGAGNRYYDSRGNCNAIIQTSTNKLIFGCKNSIIPNTVTSIAQNAFYFCRGLPSLTIPLSVSTIHDYAFYGCGVLEQIVVEEGNPNFDSRGNCNALIRTSTNELFLGCNNTVIPNSVTRIGEYACYYCTGLTGDLLIPNSVTSIGYQAFYGCDSLTSLTIGNSVTSIGHEACSNCNGLTEIIMLGTTPPSIGYFGAFSNTNDCPIYVPYESLNDYKTATNWSRYESRIFPWLQKSVEGYGEDADNWRFIASPILANTAPTAVNNMITETAYDLYRLDQSEDLEWRNYEDSENTQDFMLVNGQGYLYANEEDVNLIFKGNFNEDETKEVALAYTEDNLSAAMRGWNLIGNPFPVSGYADRSYYVMNEDGTAIDPVAVSSSTAIAPCTGIMVKAEGTGETVTFSKTAPETQGQNTGMLQIAVANTNTRSNAVEDKAIVSFNVGDALEKFTFNANNAQLYIPQGGKEYAIAFAEKQGELPLNFKATKNGTYTITVNPEDAELEYLHLIDNLTGADVDLLALRQAQGPMSYTFEAKTTDYASRFRLVFSVCGDADGDDAPFAFINNGNIIIIGAEADAVLQMVDVLGHVIVSTDVARNISTGGMAKGMYILRLIESEKVRTQKIVID